MADISKELEKLRSAVYGEEVRGAFISVAEKTNEVAETTEAAEKKRVSAESARVSAENTRVSQENARKQAETARSQAETKRAEAEETRTNQENARKQAETARSQAETGRANAEKTRVTQEEARKTAETARAGAESTRVSQENARASAETSRADAEKARGTAETGRVNAEQKRQTDTGSAIESCNTATDRANKAAKAAEDVVAGKGFIPANEKGTAGGVAQLDDNGKVPAEQMADIGKLTSLFSKATVRVNLESGETLDVSLGKIMKWFADLQPHAFEAPVQNLTTTVAGKALDATMGKQINDDLSTKYNTLNSTLATKQNKLLKGTPTAQDFNSLREPGWYWINPDVVTSNRPVSRWGMLEVCDTGGIMQRFTAYSEDGLQMQYVRMYSNSKWTPWSKTSPDVFVNKTILKDVLNIDTNNPLNPLNFTKWPVYNKSGNTANMPGSCIIGVREFLYFNENWFVIKITEFSPQFGRLWYRAYDKPKNSWGNWTSK